MNSDERNAVIESCAVAAESGLGGHHDSACALQIAALLRSMKAKPWAPQTPSEFDAVKSECVALRDRLEAIANFVNEKRVS